MTKQERSLDLVLVDEISQEPGHTIESPGGVQVRLDAATVSMRVAVSGADGLTVTEARWCIDRVLRRLTKLMPFQRAQVVDNVGLPALADALRLDLTRRGTAQDDLDPALALTGQHEALYRRWVDEDPTIRTSLAIASDAQAWATDRAHVTTEVLEPDELKRLGLNLMLAVGGASHDSPPRLVIARYRPPVADGELPTMLLGKGITFDTGGINVKPYDSYVSMMKNDMAGAALAWSLFTYLVESGSPHPLTCVMPTCDNPVGIGAMRPGSLVKSHRGHTVRIDHTDAEGRLVLADGLSYVTSTEAHRRVICFATLTTSALIAYGPYATPVHFAPTQLQAALADASETTGEDLHFLPRRVWHFEANRDPIGDLRNTARLPANASRGAGSRNAGHFLLHFTDTPLTHLDIFASTWNWAGDAPGAGAGATGAPFRTLAAALTDPRSFVD